MLPENRIIEYKVLFYHHLSNLDRKSLAYRIMQEERKTNISGYLTEVKRYLSILNISEASVMTSNKKLWKQTVRRQVRLKNKCDLLEQIKYYKKLDYSELKEEDFEIKSYFKTMNLKDARTMFALRVKMTRYVKTHFFNDKEYAKSL